jgi:hypothetical protein
MQTPFKVALSCNAMLVAAAAAAAADVHKRERISLLTVAQKKVFAVKEEEAAIHEEAEAAHEELAKARVCRRGEARFCSANDRRKYLSVLNSVWL